MKQIIAFLLVACTVAAVALPHSHFQIQQSEESSEESSEDALEEYASFGKIGFVVSLCSCVRPKGSASENSEGSVLSIDCYCQEGDASLSEESSEESSGEESSEESEGSELTFYPRFNTTDQALLGCTCLFKPKVNESSEESSEESSNSASNQTFLLPTYTGNEIIPIDCVCKNLDNTVINTTTDPLLDKLLIPAINSSSKIDFDGNKILPGDKVRLSQAQDLTQLIPIWCNVSAAKKPFFNGTIVNADETAKSYFAKCAPKLNPGIDNVTFQTAVSTITFAAVAVPIPKWGAATFTGFDVTQVTGLDPNQQEVNVFGLNATWVNAPFQLTNTSVPIQAPPFMFVGPNVLDTYPVLQSPNLQGAMRKLRKRLLF